MTRLAKSVPDTGALGLDEIVLRDRFDGSISQVMAHPVRVRPFVDGSLLKNGRLLDIGYLELLFHREAACGRAR